MCGKREKGSKILRLRLPNKMRLIDSATVDIRLVNADYGITWMEYFHKYVENSLYEKIAKIHSIENLQLRDNRSYVDKWWALNDKVGDFVHSFKRNRSILTGSLMFRRVNTLTPQQSQRSRSRGRASCTSTSIPGNTTASLNQIGREVGSRNCLVEEIAEDDTESVADSQADLHEQGIQGRVIKPTILDIISRSVSNAQLLRIQAELRDVMVQRKWLDRTGRIPVTGNFLQMLFLQREQN